jgi:hypothetical protein
MRAREEGENAFALAMAQIDARVAGVRGSWPRMTRAAQKH